MRANWGAEFHSTNNFDTDTFPRYLNNVSCYFKVFKFATETTTTGRWFEANFDWSYGDGSYNRPHSLEVKFYIKY